MHVQPDAFRTIVKRTLGTARLGAEEATALVGIAYLALDTDGREDSEELAVVDELAQQVCALAGTAVPAPGVRATDAYERVDAIRQLGGKLSTAGSRELAYAIAYAVTISDMDLAPEEIRLLSNIALSLQIADQRAAEIAELTAAAVTPA